MPSLTDGTRRRLNRLFKERDRAEAARLLSEDCDADSMYLSTASESEVERCHFAALKLSHGNVESLVDAIMLAHTDFRDLLMAAGFGEDVHAHLNWLPGSE